MNISKLTLLASINCLIVSATFGSESSQGPNQAFQANCTITSVALGSEAPQDPNQALQDEASEHWLSTNHEVGPQTLAALKHTATSLEKTADTLKHGVQNAKIQASINISSANSMRLTGIGMTLLATASILYSGEVNKVNGTALTSGATLLFGARKIGDCIDQDHEQNQE